MAKDVIPTMASDLPDFEDGAPETKEQPKEAPPVKEKKKKPKIPKNPRSKHLKKLFVKVKENGSSSASIVDEASATFSRYSALERIEVLISLESEFCTGKSKKTAELRNRRRKVLRKLIRLECVRHASQAEKSFHMFRLAAEKRIGLYQLMESLDKSTKTSTGARSKSVKDIFLLCFTGKLKKPEEIKEALESADLAVQFEEAFALFQEWCNVPVLLSTLKNPLRHDLSEQISLCKKKLLNDEQVNLQFEDINMLKSPSKSLHFAVLHFYYAFLRDIRDPPGEEPHVPSDGEDRMSFAMEFLELLNEDPADCRKPSSPPPPPPPMPQHQQHYSSLNVTTGMGYSMNATALSPANADDFKLCYEALYSPPTNNAQNPQKRKIRFPPSAQTTKKMHVENEMENIQHTDQEGVPGENGKENLWVDDDAFWELTNSSPSIPPPPENTTRPNIENLSEETRPYALNNNEGTESHVLKLPLNHGTRSSVRRLRDILNEGGT